MVPIPANSDQNLTSATSATPVSEASTSEERALNRSIAVAVQTLNGSGHVGPGREVTFSLDQTTKRPVVKVVDTATNEVVEQWPSEYLLQLAADTQKLTRYSG